MRDQYERIPLYLHLCKSRYNIAIYIKDYCGFTRVDKDVLEALRPFLSHDNPFCNYIKKDPVLSKGCRLTNNKINCKLKRTRCSFSGLCHCGVGEYVIPIISGDTLIGSLNVGHFVINREKAEHRISVACSRSSYTDSSKAISLYRSFLQKPAADIENYLPELQLVADYIGEVYKQICSNNHSDSIPTTGRLSDKESITDLAIYYIETNYNQHISIPSLAKSCNCSESYLSRIFKKQTGVNINKYINKVRVEKAKKLLLDSNLCISEIANEVGFSDPNYFSQVFHKLTEFTPKQFRRNYSKITFSDE